MKQETSTIKIYQLSHPMMNTEWESVLGDKYRQTLPAQWEMTQNWEHADVIVWDGVITPKLAPYLKAVMESFVDNKILLLVGESFTLLKNQKAVQLVKLEKIRYVEIPGWSVLPEDILEALELCYKKLKHV